MAPHDSKEFFRRELAKRPYIIAFALALVGLGVWTLLPLPKREVKRVIQQIERIVEARQIERLQPILSERFSSRETGDRDETIDLLTQLFEDVLSIQIQIKQIQIDVRGKQATALVAFYISGTIKGGHVYSQIPFRGISDISATTNSLEQCRTTFAKEKDGVWRLTGAELLAPAQVPLNEPL